MTELRELILFRNDVISLPREIGELRELTNLDLRYTQITHLPKELSQLINLKYIDLRRSPIVDNQDNRDIIDDLKNNGTVVKIDWD